MLISQFYFKNKRLFLGALLYFLLPGTALLQTTTNPEKRPDPLATSLQRVVELEDPDRQFRALIGISRVYGERMNPFTLQFINNRLEQVQLGDPIIPAATLFLIGEFLNVNLQDFESSLDYYQSALAQTPVQDEELRMRLLDRISSLSLKESNLEEAIPAAEECIEIGQRTGKWFSLGHCQMCMGDLHSDYFDSPRGRVDYYQSALENFTKSFSENLTNKDTLATLLNLFFITRIKLDLKNGFQDGLSYLDTAATLITQDEKYNDFRAQITYLQGQFLTKRGDYATAIDSFSIAYEQFRVTKDTARMMQTRYLMADAFFNQGQNREAIESLNGALELAPKVASANQLEAIYDLLHRAAKKDGDLATALAAHEAYFTANQQVNKEDQQRFIRGLETQYELRNKQLEIERQKTEITQKSIDNRKLTFGIILLVVLLGLLLSSFIRAQNNRDELRTRNSIIIKQKQQLEELDDMKSLFFNNISHELKTPLALIKAPLEYLQKKFSPGPEGDFFLNTALKNTARLEHLVKELLDISKIEAGNTSIDLKPCDLHLLLEQNMESFGPLAESNGIQLSYQGPDNSPILAWADQSAFQKIITNLISNAIKFSESGTQVLLRLTIKDELAIVSVKDHGPGIYADDLPNIFNRFHQSKHNDVHHNNSTGIGLSLSNELAKQMDGKLSVESERGQGSNFFLSLPLAKLTDLTESATEMADEKGSEVKIDIFGKLEHWDQSEYHILIVEDNKDLRSYLAKLLGEYFQVYTVANGQEAIDFMATVDSPILLPGKGLIISDLMMPVMDGFDLLETLKKDKTYQTIPVIMLTARQDSSQRLKALAVGVDDYLVKPFNNQELLIRVKNLLLRHHEKAKYAQPVGEARHDENTPMGIGQDHNSLDSEQLSWLKDLEAFAIKHIGDSQFNVSFLSNYANMSERNFLRRIKKTTGLTPSEYIKEIRLHHARQLLESGSVKSVKAVSKAVGFSSQEYFSDIFHNHFGRRPSTYLT